MNLLRNVLAASVFSVVASAQTPYATVRVNVGGENSNPANLVQGASIAATSARFVAVWAEQFGTSSATKDIYSASTSLGPAFWSSPVRVDLGNAANSSDSELPRVVATSDGSFHCFWEDARGAGSGGSEDLYYSRSSNGTTWLASPLALNTGTIGGASDVDGIQVSANGLELHAVWEDDAVNGGDVDEVRYVRSLDGGATWSSITLISAGQGIDSDNPMVTAFGSTVIVAWINNSNGNDGIRLRRSTNHGAFFGSTLSIESSEVGDVDFCAIASDGTLVVIAYLDDDTPGPGGNSVHGILSLDGGATWQPEIELSPLTNSVASARVSSFDVAVHGPDIYVLFASDAASLLQGQGSLDGMHLSRSHDFGGSWFKDLRLDLNGEQPQARPSLAVDICGVWAMWASGTDNQTKLCRAFSRNRGQNWTSHHTDEDDFDFEPQGSGPTLAMRESDHMAVSIAWEKSTGANELYAGAVAGCTPQPQTYCPLSTTADGCLSYLSVSGVPDASASSGFDFIATGLPGIKPGLFFYGLSGRQALPWGTSGAQLCLQPPTQRMTVFNSGGVYGQCNGLITEDWNTFCAVSPNALGTPFVGGEIVQAQCWFRDPASQKTTGLTNALEFAVQP